MTFPPAPQRTAPRATAALIVGIVSLLLSPGIAIGTAVVGVSLMAHTDHDFLSVAMPAVGLLLGIPAVVMGFAGLAQAGGDPAYHGRRAAIGAMVLGALSSVAAVGLGYVALLFGAVAAAGPGGRPYRVAGRAVTAGAEDGGDWAGAATPSLHGLTPAEREVLAAAWEHEARGEHASIASFSRLALDLLAAGAPPDLVAAAHRAALDEVAHARVCFGLASAYAGRPRTAGPWPDAAAGGPTDASRSALLVRLAVESLVDGGLHEGFAAAAAREGAVRPGDSAVRAVLARLADDEARHAELGWSVIAWCTAEGGETVRAAVARAAGALPTACGRACVVPGDRDASGAAALFASTLASVAERARHGARGDLRSPGPQDGVPRVRGVSAQVAAAPPREAAEAVAAVA